MLLFSTMYAKLHKYSMHISIFIFAQFTADKHAKHILKKDMFQEMYNERKEKTASPNTILSPNRRRETHKVSFTRKRYLHFVKKCLKRKTLCLINIKNGNKFKIFNRNTQFWFHTSILQTILTLEIKFKVIQSIYLGITRI